MDDSRLERSVPTWTLEQEMGLLSVAEELLGVWDAFAFDNGPGIVPASSCRKWGERILGAFDGSCANPESKSEAVILRARGNR